MRETSFHFAWSAGFFHFSWEFWPPSPAGEDCQPAYANLLMTSSNHFLSCLSSKLQNSSLPLVAISISGVREGEEERHFHLSACFQWHHPFLRTSQRFIPPQNAGRCHCPRCQTADQASHEVLISTHLCPRSRLSQACWSTQYVSISGNKILGYASPRRAM